MKSGFEKTSFETNLKAVGGKATERLRFFVFFLKWRRLSERAELLNLHKSKISGCPLAEALERSGILYKGKKKKKKYLQEKRKRKKRSIFFCS